jgi:UDP-N-acetylmuramoylalanine-D-glutamate ligase
MARSLIAHRDIKEAGPQGRHHGLDTLQTTILHTLRNVIKQFNADGLDVLQAGSSRPHRLRTVMDAQAMQYYNDPKIVRHEVACHE